jgi:cytochrome c peroxidase
VKTSFVALALALGGCQVLGGCQAPEAEPIADGLFPTPTQSHATAADPFEPIPLTIGYDAAAAAIGEKLFNDPILSDDGKVKCVDCHDLERFGGGDGKAVPDIEGRERGLTNSTTVFNIALFFRYGWNGAHDDMEHHLDAPMRSARVMAIASWGGVVERLRANAAYREAFARAFPRAGVTEANVRHAIAEYQRSLITPNAPFDRMLRGEGHAGLSASAAAGYALFKNLGCVTCHQGIGVGGNMFQKFGVMIPYPEGREPTPADQGRYRVTQNEDDMLVFRVPSLRNVAVTAPYFHDGSVPTLAEAVRSMGRHQLGRDLSETEVGKLVHFLYALTGELNGKALTAENAPDEPPAAAELQ